MNEKKDKKDKKDIVDKNLFRAMSYEFAGEIGVLDNEEMKNNEKLNPKKHKENEEKK